MTAYSIRFVFEEGDTWYAGDYGGGLGFAPTLETAKTWEDQEIAARFLEHGYGERIRSFGRVVEVEA